jgi:mannose PTS system EIIA component
MSISILIISHYEIGNALVKTAKTTFGNDKLPLPTFVVGVLPDANPEELIPDLKELIRQLDHGDGVLILTDLFGATPSNIAQGLYSEKVRIVTGLNLPMLLRVLNFTKLNLDQLAECACKGGQSGIIECDKIDDGS